MSGLTVIIGLWEFDYSSHVESDGRVVSDYMETYLLKTNSISRPAPSVITTALGIFPGAPFYDDFNATCHDVKIKGGPTKTRVGYLAYLIECAWATNAVLPQQDSTDPTTRRTIWSGRPQIQQRFATRYPGGSTLAGQLILNAAGQPFDGGVPVDARIGSFQATRNADAAGYSLPSVIGNSGKMNSVAYLGFPAGTLQVDIESHEAFEGGYHFYQETYTFTYDPLGLQPTIANAGFFQRTAIGSNTLKRIIESDLAGTGSNPVMEPEPLDSNGILVPIASRPASCSFQTVPYFATMDFTTFGL